MAKSTTATLAKDLRQIREDLRVSQEVFSRLIGVSVKTISRWENNENTPSPLALERISRWQTILQMMRRLMKEEALQRWLNAPNEALEGRTPLEVAQSPGGTEEIVDLLGRIEWGIPS